MQQMAVVQFPDEIIRHFLARLDASPQFPVYLGALAYCARKALDPSPLHAWWKAHASKIESENVELDFVDFLNGIITSKKTWEVTSAERLAEIEDAKQSRLDRKHNASLSDNERTLYEIMDSVFEHYSKQDRFIDDHPEYRCVSSALDYHDLFSQVFDNRSDPLKLMARWASALLPCGLTEKERPDYYEAAFSTRGRFGYEDERPAVYLIGSDSHAHLLELADWVAKQTNNERLGTVLRWSLCNEFYSQVPSEVLTAACTCTHATFVHIINDQEVEPKDVDGLISLLSVPLALSASRSGPPHLLPEFSFLGASSYFETSVRDMRGTTSRQDLFAAWRQFFHRYRNLRVRDNGGRGFHGAGELIRTALANYAGEELCYTEPDSTCVEDCIRDLQPDESCLLDFFLFHFSAGEESLRSDAEGNSQFVAVFSMRKMLLPILKVLRERSMHELASAMLAYYLVVSAIGAKGNLDGLDGLDEALIESRRLPGAECVEQALMYVCAFAEHQGHRITRMNFEQFLVPDDRKVRELILAGEGETIEFKSTLRVNLQTGEHDRKIEHAVLKTIAAFLNKRGGILLVGVDDAGNILGTEDDRFPNADKLLLHFKNLVNATAPNALDQIDFKMVSLEKKEILYVECSRGDRPIYLLNRDTKQHEFYVRRGPATDRLDMPDAFAYIQKEFSGSRLAVDD
jgi:hypothetical protein